MGADSDEEEFEAAGLSSSKVEDLADSAHMKGVLGDDVPVDSPSFTVKVKKMFDNILNSPKSPKPSSPILSSDSALRPSH